MHFLRRVHGLLPTGALTNKTVVGTTIAAGPDAQGFEAEDLLQIPVFMGVFRHLSRTQSRAIVKAAASRKGESSAEGEFALQLSTFSKARLKFHLHSIAHVKTRRRERIFASVWTSTLRRPQEDKRRRKRRDRTIPIDASVDLAYGNPVADSARRSFGEMTCMNFYPAVRDSERGIRCRRFEMLRNVLDIMLKNKLFRAQRTKPIADEPRKSPSRRTYVRGSFTGNSSSTLESSAPAVLPARSFQQGARAGKSFSILFELVS